MDAPRGAAMIVAISITRMPESGGLAALSAVEYDRGDWRHVISLSSTSVMGARI
jgi:hypothetical protein